MIVFFVFSLLCQLLSFFLLVLTITSFAKSFKNETPFSTVPQHLNHKKILLYNTPYFFKVLDCVVVYGVWCFKEKKVSKRLHPTHTPLCVWFYFCFTLFFCPKKKHTKAPKIIDWFFFVILFDLFFPCYWGRPSVLSFLSSHFPLTFWGFLSEPPILWPYGPSFVFLWRRCFEGGFWFVFFCLRRFSPKSGFGRWRSIFHRQGTQTHVYNALSFFVSPCENLTTPFSNSTTNLLQFSPSIITFQTHIRTPSIQSLCL